MPIIAFGLNHRTAGIDLRGRASILENDLEHALNVLVGSAPCITGAIILSTCNRTELHCSLADVNQEIATDHLLNWFANYQQITLAELQDKTYTYWNADAVKHIMRVAAGLDSQVLGEPQIFGQYKNAYDRARSANTVHADLEQVVTATIHSTKHIRTHTDLGKNSISVAGAAVTMAKKIFSDLSSNRALLLGAGETIYLVSQHLKSANVQDIGIANRTLRNAQSLASKIDGHAMPLSEFGNVVHEYDIVISSTNSATPVVSQSIVAAACSKRRFRPMFFVDLAVPRDIEPQVSELANVYVYTIDDLTSIIESNIESRQNAAEEARDHIERAYVEFEKNIRIRKGSELVKRYRQKLELMRDQETAEALQRLNAGENPEEVLRRMARDLTNKIANEPTLSLRNASETGDQKQLESLRNLFGLD